MFSLFTVHEPKPPWLLWLILLGPNFFLTCLCVYACVCVRMYVSHLRLMQNLVDYMSECERMINNFPEFLSGRVLGPWLGARLRAGPQLLSA